MSEHSAVRTERIFVLFGVGHVPILRHLVALSSRHRLVDVLPFLE